MYSLPELLHITNSTQFELNIDWSAISIDHYEKIKHALVKFGPTKFPRISFNCHTKETHKAAIIGREKNLPHVLESSIAFQLPNFECEIAALISRILFKTKRVHNLILKSIQFDFSDLDVICQGIEACSSLRRLKLVSIPLCDEGFERLSASLRKKSVTELELRKCELSDACSSEVRQLVKFHTIIQKRQENIARREKKRADLVCLSSIDLRGNKFTRDFVDDIKEIVDNSPVYRFDIRDNVGIPSDIKLSTKFEIGSSPKRGRKAIMNSEDKLRRENEKLKGRINRLLGRKNIAAVNDYVFIIGRRAPELADHIFSLDRLCTKLEQEQQQRKSRRTGHLLHK